MRTEIIATVRRIDSQKNFESMISKLIKNNVKYYRFNMRKFDEKNIVDLYADLKILQQNADIKVMLDLPYPGNKLKIKTFHNEEIRIKKNQILTIEYSDIEPAKENYLCINKQGFSDNLIVGDLLFYADGEGAFEVIKRKYTCSICVKALNDFSLYPYKSIFTKKIFKEYRIPNYLKDIIKEILPESIALSFVEKPEDIQWIYDCFLEKNKCPQIISKIETNNGVKNIEKILTETDGIMIARGDLGLSIKPEELYCVQQYITRKAQQYGKTVMIATDILKSLVSLYLPSRADIIDCYEILRQGLDYLVLNCDLLYEGDIDRICSLIYSMRNSLGKNMMI